MNDENRSPFNPIPLPPEFSLETHKQSAQQQTANPGAQQTKQTSGAKTRRRPRKPTAAQLDAACPVLTKWERIKGKFAETIAQIDRETLKSVLLACGIAAGVVAAVLLLIKMVPVGICMLALLGVGLLIAIWDRIRYFPRPF
jgi:hypothetical protein